MRINPTQPDAVAVLWAGGLVVAKYRALRRNISPNIKRKKPVVLFGLNIAKHRLPFRKKRNKSIYIQIEERLKK